jgi:hypothetical protein
MDDPTTQLLLRRQKSRLDLLRTLYRMAGGNRLRGFQEADLKAEMGVSDEEFEIAIMQLDADGLVECPGVVRITTEGIRELEQMIIAPGRSTEHFAAQVVQHFHAAVGAVNTGDSIQSIVVQRFDSAGALALIQEIRESLSSLPERTRAEAAEHVEDLEAEVASQTPRLSRIKATLLVLLKLGHKTVDLALKVTRLAKALDIKLGDPE